MSLGHGPDGTRIRRKLGGKTRTEVKNKLKELHSELHAGLTRPLHDRAAAYPSPRIHKAAPDN